MKNTHLKSDKITFSIDGEKQNMPGNILDVLKEVLSIKVETQQIDERKNMILHNGTHWKIKCSRKTKPWEIEPNKTKSVSQEFSQGSAFKSEPSFSSFMISVFMDIQTGSMTYEEGMDDLRGMDIKHEEAERILKLMQKTFKKNKTWWPEGWLVNANENPSGWGALNTQEIQRWFERGIQWCNDFPEIKNQEMKKKLEYYKDFFSPDLKHLPQWLEKETDIHKIDEMKSKWKHMMNVLDGSVDMINYFNFDYWDEDVENQGLDMIDSWKEACILRATLNSAEIKQEGEKLKGKKL